METSHKRKINYFKIAILALLAAIVILSVVLTVKSCQNDAGDRKPVMVNDTATPSGTDFFTAETPGASASGTELPGEEASTGNPADGDGSFGVSSASPEASEEPFGTAEPASAATYTPAPTNTPTPAPTATPAPAPTSGGSDTNTGSSATNTELMNKERKAPATQDGLQDVIISEIMSSNTKFIPSDGSYYDWVEIYNASGNPVNLSGYNISDRIKKPDKCKLPDVTLEPGGYYIIYLSGETKTGHASFKISGGESLYVFKNGEAIDEIEVPKDLQHDTTFGRYGKDLIYCVVPTPGAANSAGRFFLLSPPAASVKSGVYTSAVTVSLYATGDIYYTLDGKAPTASSQKYTGSITVTKPTSIRAIAIKDGELSGESDFTYIVDSETSRLPVLNVAANLASLENGVFKDQHSPYKGTEEEVLLTLIENGEEKFSVPCGFKLHGNDTRLEQKQNFRVRFKSQYGVSKLHYKLFDNLSISEFDALVLKGGSEDWYRAIIRDELAAEVVRDTNLYIQEYRPCVLYIGGEYWGIYFIRERLDEEYVASHLDTDPESVDMIKSCGELDAGSMADYNELRNFINSHKEEIKNGGEAYDYVMSRIDYMGLIDWFLCRGYLGDQDISNHRVFKAKNADNIWHYAFYDLDWSANPGRENYGTFSYNGERTADTFYAALIFNKDFQAKLMARAAELMETTLNGPVIISKIDKIANMIASEEPRDTARWQRRSSSWQSYIAGLKGFFDNGVRDKAFLDDLNSYIARVNS
ncbi:MAG: CotH kinase family protein [Clostridia bacterium]|nr:CotH kinase family protein [Clostridia bacterium]